MLRLNLSRRHAKALAIHPVSSSGAGWQAGNAIRDCRSLRVEAFGSEHC